MHREPGAAPEASAGGGASSSTAVQQAVEAFIELHASGTKPDAADFAARYDAELRPRILAQCREFLAFDGLLGHQEWEEGERPRPAGRSFGDFVIQEELGRGGMGVVYLAHQVSLNRRVALKVMASGLTLSKRHVERFRREAAAAAQVRHPAIVPVHNLTEVDGTFAFAMDFVAGRNVADILHDLRLANGESPTAIEGTLGLGTGKGYVAECALLAAQLASALAAAHEAGVVHRDLKPRNVMIDEKRQARLLDFGLAKSLGEGSISMSGEITGTAHYLSPEQTLAKRVPIDHRADIFSLGVILYEVLTLQRPFEGKNLQQVVYEICFKEPVPPQRRNHKVPRDLATICLKALEKDPQNRYQTAAEFEADLQRFLRWEPIHAKPASALTRCLKWVRRHRTESVAAVAVVAVATAMLAGSWYGDLQDGWEADGLLGRAEQHAVAGRLGDAVELATAALGKRNDEAGRARLALYHEMSKSVAIQEEADIAEAARRSLKSSQAIGRDRELAVLLALAADQKRSSWETRSAVLDALGGGYATTTLRSDDAQVWAAAWSPDGARIATAGNDGKVLLWDAATGRSPHTLVGHTHWVVAARFAGNGQLLLTASQDRTVRVWDLGEGRCAGVWQHEGVITTLRLDHAGERALTTSYVSRMQADGTIVAGPFQVQVWNVATGERTAPAVEHKQHVMAAALSPCGHRAASWGGERGEVRLWDTDTGRDLVRLRVDDSRVRAIEFSPDGTLLATASMSGTVRLFVVPEGTLLAEVRHSDAVDCMAFDDDGSRLLTGSRDLTARLWNLQRDGAGALQAREVRVFVGHSDHVLDVAFDRSGQLCVTGGKDGVVRVFDAGGDRVASGTELLRYEVGPGVDEVSFDADGRRILALARTQRALIWNPTDSRGVATLRQPGRVPAACFDASGNRVVTAGDDERLRLWSVRDGRQEWASPKLGNPLRALDVDEAGDRIVCATTDGRIAVHRLLDGESLFTLAEGEGCSIVRFVASGTRILTAGGGPPKQPGAPRRGRAILWNANDRSQVASLKERPREIISADFAATTSLLATVEQDEDFVRLWSVPDMEPRGEVRGHTAAVTCVRFSQDGASLLTTSHDRTARIQALDGRTIATLQAGHPLKHAAWSRDGRRVLTCAESGSNEAWLWDVATGSELLHFRGHRGAIEWANFGPDGTTAVTTAVDGTACVWPTDPVSVAERLSLRTLSAAERQRHGLTETAERKQ